MYLIDHFLSFYVYGRPHATSSRPPVLRGVLSTLVRLAVLRKVTELGLKTTYTSLGSEYRYILPLMALPFLPAGQTQSAFNTLAAIATSPVLQQMVTYMENTWISNSVWQPRNWCAFQTSIRINNDMLKVLFLSFNIFEILN
jgi:hypothetical protein